MGSHRRVTSKRVEKKVPSDPSALKAQ